MVSLRGTTAIYTLSCLGDEGEELKGPERGPLSLKVIKFKQTTTEKLSNGTNIIWEHFGLSTVCFTASLCIFVATCAMFQNFRDTEFYVGRSYFKMYIVLASIASSDSCGLRYLIFLEIGMSVVCKKEFL